jgi:tetratricopeptide (TPR) repeat protein
MEGVAVRGTTDGQPAVAPAPADEAELVARRERAIRLALEGRYAESEACSRNVLRLRPDDVDAMNELGVAVWKQSREAEAEEIFRRAGALKPDDFRIWTNLGLVLMTQDREDEAEVYFRESLRLQPRSFHAQMSMGNVLSNRGDFAAANEWLGSALAMCPDSVEALQNAAMNLARQGRLAESIAHYERAARIQPNLAELRRNLGYARLAAGDYEHGWPDHEWRLKCLPPSGCKINRTFWNGDNFHGQTILLHFEQGYGDTLQFVRYARLVKRRGGRVVMLCPSALVKLISRCEGVDMACDGVGFEPDCHIHAPLLSLPAIFGTTLETVSAEVPYLFSDPVHVERWRPVMDRLLAAGPTEARPLRIGIVWQGRPENGNDHWRSFRLEHYAPIAEIPGVRLVSLQLGYGKEQIEALGGRFPVYEVPGRRGVDFCETAAIAQHLDMVISPCTAVAHLAGGLALPVWVALSYVGDWRWLSVREDSPWYPTLRLFRQPTHGDWESVFRRMADELRSLLARRAGSLTAPADAA